MAAFKALAGYSFEKVFLTVLTNIHEFAKAVIPHNFYPAAMLKSKTPRAVVPSQLRTGITRFTVGALLSVTSVCVHANTLIETARQFEERGNYQSAVATYQQYLSSDPEKALQHD